MQQSVSHSPVLIQEDHRNATLGYMLGEPEVLKVVDTVLDGLSVGEIYRWYVGEYGRCVGKVRVDTEDGRTLHVGWVFVKRDRYEDSGETFLHETW